MRIRREVPRRYNAVFLAMAWLSWLLPAQADQDLQRLGWELSFNDEFSTGPLKSWKWNQADGPNAANQEKQWYTPDNVVVTNGNLVLVSERRNINGWEYASGKVDTAGRFDQQYGYWEVRAKLPYGQGMWPAHWMLGYQGWPPEIDIMEFRGNDPTWALFSMHWGPLPPGCAHPWECGQTQSSDYRGPDYTAGFHTFAIDQLYLGATNLVLEWDSVSGKTYSVWYATNLVHGALLPAATNLPATAPTNSVLLPVPPGPGRFYQLNVTDPSLMGAE